MSTLSKSHSPKQVARALGVSESSLKRWCDRGLIPTIRTGGGHRKVRTSDVLAFALKKGMSLVTPDLLGLPSVSPQSVISLERSVSILASALLQGDETVSRQLVYNLLLAGHPLCRIFDDVIAKAFHQIGDKWACQEIDIYQERRSCEIMLGILFDLRNSLTPPNGTLIACGGNGPGNLYALQTMMVELVLRECGFSATSLGIAIPFESLTRAIHEIQPTIFWLSCAHIADRDEFLNGMHKLEKACLEESCSLVVGGRAIGSNLRERFPDAIFCQNMQELAAFANSIQRTAKRLRKKTTSSSKPSKKKSSEI